MISQQLLFWSIFQEVVLLLRLMHSVMGFKYTSFNWSDFIWNNSEGKGAIMEHGKIFEILDFFGITIRCPDPE